MTRLRSPHPSAWLQSAVPSLPGFILISSLILAEVLILHGAGLIGG